MKIIGKTMGKTVDGSINCRNIRRVIEEAEQSEPLSLAIADHLKACVRCETFYDQQLKLRQIVSSLGTVAAPNDFEFRLRARLAGEKRGAGQSFSIGNLSFGFRSAALATLMLLIGSGLLVLSLRPSTSDSLVADSASSGSNSVKTPSSMSAPVPDNSSGAGQPPALAKNTDQSDEGPNSGTTSSTTTRVNRREAGRTPVALASNRIKSRELNSTPAKVLKAGDLVAAGHSVFPIDASPQALTVSLDNGRGSSKTVSVPGVSFGSQRVLSQNSSPLLASSRGAW